MCDVNVGCVIVFMVVMVFGYFSIILLFFVYFVGDMVLFEKYFFLVYVIGGIVSVVIVLYVGWFVDCYGC